jgi:hypothetical protein
MQRVGITGHQNIPTDAQPFVIDGIRKTLAECGTRVLGVSCLAAGADQLFASIVLELGGSLKAVIPCERYEESFTSSLAKEAFAEFLARSDECETLSYSQPTEQAYLDAGKRVVELSELIIAVWDGRPSKGKGGTADIVGYARERGKNAVVIWPQNTDR